jgi:hypothetical protein
MISLHQAAFGGVQFLGKTKTLSRMAVLATNARAFFFEGVWIEDVFTVLEAMMAVQAI